MERDDERCARAIDGLQRAIEERLLGAGDHRGRCDGVVEHDEADRPVGRGEPLLDPRRRAVVGQRKLGKICLVEALVVAVRPDARELREEIGRALEQGIPLALYASTQHCVTRHDEGGRALSNGSLRDVRPDVRVGPRVAADEHLHVARGIGSGREFVDAAARLRAACVVVVRTAGLEPADVHLVLAPPGDDGEVSS